MDFDLLSLHNHLSDALTTQRLACHEVLVLESSDRITSCRCQHDNSRRDQTAWIIYCAQDLEDSHAGVHACSHVVCSDLPDQSVKLGGRRTYSEKKRDLDKDEDQSACTVIVSCEPACTS